MNYQRDVLQDAVDFMKEIKDDVIEAIINGLDWDYNDINNLDSEFHESVTDRSYSLQDAAYILENCENVETDSGLWDGKDPDEALSIQAAWSYSNDVWFMCEGLYDEMKDEYESRLAKKEECELTGERGLMEGLTHNDELELASAVFDETIESYWPTAKPVEPGSDEEKWILKRWLKLNDAAGMWAGFPLGGSYIDSMVGTGHSIPNVKDYVDFDHEAAKKLPHLRGKYVEEIKKYYHDTFENEEPTPSTKDNEEYGIYYSPEDRMWYWKRNEDGYTSQPFNGMDYALTAFLNNEIDWQE